MCVTCAHLKLFSDIAYSTPYIGDPMHALQRIKHALHPEVPLLIEDLDHRARSYTFAVSLDVAHHVVEADERRCLNLASMIVSEKSQL